MPRCSGKHLSVQRVIKSKMPTKEFQNIQPAVDATGTLKAASCSKQAVAPTHLAFLDGLRGTALLTCITLLGAYTVGYVCHKLVEKPGIRLGQKILAIRFPVRTSGPPAAKEKQAVENALGKTQ